MKEQPVTEKVKGYLVDCNYGDEPSIKMYPNCDLLTAEDGSKFAGAPIGFEILHLTIKEAVEEALADFDSEIIEIRERRRKVATMRRFFGKEDQLKWE